MSSNFLALMAKKKVGGPQPKGDGPKKRKRDLKAASRPQSVAKAAPSSSGILSSGLPRLPPKPFRAHDSLLTDLLALDCEMVGVGAAGTRSALAQVVLVNSREELVYSTYVRPRETITDFRTAVSGVRPCHLMHAVPFRQAQAEVSSLVYQRRVVGHAVHNDFKVLQLLHPKSSVRDTANFAPFRTQNGPTSRARKLSDLARERLGMTIQTGEHSPLEDAVAALRLYKLHAAEWERSHKQSKGEPTAKKRRKLAAAAAAAAGDAGGGDAGEDVADEVSVGGAGAGVGASGRPTSGPGRKPYKQIGSKKRKVLKLGEAKRGAKRS